MGIKLDLDSGNKEKSQKHGVSLSQIIEVFAGEPDFFPDEAHSDEEERFIAIGRTEAGKHIFVAFTFREIDDEIRIRPISARPMHDKEIQEYERKKSDERR
jgi:uncharacterized DUF497 family protein